MLEYMNSLKLRSDGREIQRRGTSWFPCGIYCTVLGNYAGGEVPWHWHEEIELKLVFEGAAVISCGEDMFLLQPGEGLFINSRVLHRTSGIDAANCVLGSIVFDWSVLTGSLGNIFEERYFRPICENPALAAVHLTNAIPWKAQALQQIRAAYEAGASGEFGYELDVRAGLSRFWSEFSRANLPAFTAPHCQEDETTERMRCMLDFVETHFTEDITPADIAQAAHISERECFRCFDRVIGMPPIAFLIRRRVAYAAKLLRETSLSVTDICSQAGFHSPSYFGKRFREQLGCTPREFRALGEFS